MVLQIRVPFRVLVYKGAIPHWAKGTPNLESYPHDRQDEVQGNQHVLQSPLTIPIYPKALFESLRPRKKTCSLAHFQVGSYRYRSLIEGLQPL